MMLAAGTRVGPYQILASLGAGGMGEVYRATDANLGRQVAVKILPDTFAYDPERLARFEREARTLATLNHPNIAQIYGVEKADSIRALVLELVEGPTLADRIAGGPIALDETLPIARQIAEALEAAHEQGIVHRDLKPANVKVRADGTVKVLDFGLAKVSGPAEAGPYVQEGVGAGFSRPDASQSPTITSPAMTGMGVILGTAAYKSPEQARGRGADRRSDMWSFGCVLYEMLTGRRAFEADDVTDTLAFVITKEPAWSALPATTPPSIRRLLRRCLEKDRKRRLADAVDARLEIDDALAGPSNETVTPHPSPPTPWWRRPVVIAPALLLGGLLAGAAGWSLKPASTPSTVTRFAFTLPEGQQFTNTGRGVVAISPDGTQLVYVANNQLYLRSISELDARAIPGTEAKEGTVNPVFSPDSGSIAFVSAGMLKRVPVSGGAAATLGPVGSTPG